MFDQKLHFSPPTVPRLGLTVHAGEDYYHPAGGMRYVWQTVKRLDMNAGDRIGHGLALGVDLEAFHRRYGRAIVAPVGDTFDTLVWLRKRLSVLEDTVSERTLRSIDDKIAECSLSLFGKQYSPELLYRAQKARHFPVVSENSKGKEIFGDEMWEVLSKECFGPELRRKREEMRILPEVFDYILQDLRKLQDVITNNIANAGIVIESNPSSNVMVGDFDQMSTHPMFRMKETAPYLRWTINCDNPGTFRTSPEIEYALVKQSIKERYGPNDSGKADELIGAALKDGWEGSFLQDAECPPGGQGGPRTHQQDDPDAPISKNEYFLS